MTLEGHLSKSKHPDEPSSAAETGGSGTRTLLFGAPALVALLIASAPMLGRFLNSLFAILAISTIYWIVCWGLALKAVPLGRLRSMYEVPINRRPLELLLTWVPVVATFSIVFLHAAPHLPARILAAIALVALVNGVTEELFWRGGFVVASPGDIRLAYFYPTILFAAWHFALALVPGVVYHGGVPALVGGAAAMGLGWGWVVWKTRDIRSVTVAHVLTNTFAFSGLVLDTWVGV